MVFKPDQLGYREASEVPTPTRERFGSMECPYDDNSLKCEVKSEQEDFVCGLTNDSAFSYKHEAATRNQKQKFKYGTRNNQSVRSENDSLSISDLKVTINDNFQAY